MVEAGGRHPNGSREGEGLALPEAQREAAAERVAHDDRRLAGLVGDVKHGGGREGVELGQHGARRKAAGGAESWKVDGERAVVRAAEAIERPAPSVRRVGEAV